MVSRSQSSTLRQAVREAPNGTTSVALAVVTALALFAVLFPWFPGSQRLDVGVIPDSDVVAPREATYESQVLTVQQRDAAAAAIQDVLVLNTEIRDVQLADLERILNSIDLERRDPTKSASAKETTIQGLLGTNLSQRSAGVFVAASDVRWSTMQTEARDALSRTLTGAIGPDELEQARTRAGGFLSALLSADEMLALTELLDPMVVPTLEVSLDRTEALRREARSNTPPVRVTYAPGQVITPAGTPIDEAAFEAIERLEIRTGGVTIAAVIASAIAAALAGATLGAHLWVTKPRSLRGFRRLGLLVLTLVVPVLVAKFAFPPLLPDTDRLYLTHALPLAAGAVVAGVLLDVSSGVIVALLLAGIVGFLSVAIPNTAGAVAATQLDALRMVLATLAAGLGGLYVAARAERLQGYLGAGLAVTVTSAAVAVMVLLLGSEREVTDLAWIAGSSAAGGLMVAVISVGAFVLLSRPFGIITRVELMELVQLNHPLLRRLQDEAPGTFQHSMLVGSLADRAADRIGADSLLVRVGAYYHDIGKLHSPGFFVENYGDGPNPHDNLDPLQSSRVIMRHVSAGVELARKHNLPEAVVSFIPQHHGSRLVAYFYREAAKVKPDIDPQLFQYQGPKPQTREAALVMLADSCEASVRASSDRTSDRIRQIVEGIVAERVEEGQFDECDLSMRDLRIVVDSFVQALSAIYHPRVEYPAPTAREMEARGHAPAAGEPRERTGTSRAPGKASGEAGDEPVLSEDDS